MVPRHDDARDRGAAPARRGRWASRGIVAGCVLLGIPTAVAPDSIVASVTYLVGLAATVIGLVAGSRRWQGPARLGWAVVAAAAGCWFVGDLAQRVTPWFGGDPDAPGLPDVMWLTSYPIMVVGVAVMIHGRRLGADIRREVSLDVLVVTVAGAVGAWKLMIAPGLDSGTLTTDVLLTVLYPLGDVALFATALTLLIAPGRPSAAGRLLVVCLGATLVIDATFTALATVAPDLDTSALDALLLPVNSLLAAGALHPSGSRLAEAPDRALAAPLHRWRVVLLGGALVVVSVAAVLPATEAGAADTVILMCGAAATSVSVVARFYGVVRQREAAERRLAHQAHHDHLTGLANRALLLQRLDDHLSGGRRVGDPDAPDPVLLYLDLDGFKAINDRYGHAAGDVVLTTVAGRLQQLTRTGDTVARLGGDEFVVLCSDVRAEAAEALGEKLCAAVSEPIELPGPERVRVGASVGVTRVRRPRDPAATLDPEDLLRSADGAMYRAKHLGGGVRLA